MNKIFQHIQWYWPVLLMVLIFIESSIPMDGGPHNITFLTNLDPDLQNLLHIPLYGVLSFLWVKLFLRTRRQEWPVKYIVGFSLIITVCYGCFDEFHQSFVPGRYGGLLDIYLDAGGAVLGVMLGLKF